MFASDYIRFQARVEAGAAGEVLLIADEASVPAALEPIRVAASDLAIAQGFDGHHSLEAVLQGLHAAGSSISRDALVAFVAELAVHGVMLPGRCEPLPPPRQRDAVSTRRRPDPARRWPSPPAYPPPSVPGSLAQPGMLQGFLGHELPGTSHAVAARLFIRLGRVFLWPLQGRLSLVAALLCLGAAFYLVYAHRHEWLRYSVLAMPGWRIVLHIAFALWLVNLVGAAAQAAAIARHGGSAPLVFWARGAFRLPLFAVDSTRVASHVGRQDRLRIVAASLSATAHLIVLGAMLWVMTAGTLPLFASAVSITATAATFSLLLRLNPLVMREGQQLLVNHLGIVDLQRQAFGALLGRRRPWNTQTRVVPRGWLVLYAVLTIVFAIGLLSLLLWVVGGFLERRHQGAGVVLILFAMGFLVVKQYSRATAEKTSLGEPPRSWWPRRRTLLITAAVLFLGLIPYPYEPGGRFEVLPNQRADVRALTAGDVREVLAQEGDLVEAGAGIVRLDDTQTRALVESHEAQLASLRADLALTLKGAKSEEIEVARQRVETATTSRNLAEASFRRISQAYKTRSVTAETYDQARGAAEVAAEELEEAQRALDLVQSPAEQERIASLEADIQRVQAELTAARSDLNATRVSAPIAGRVVAPRLMFARGEYLNRGDLIATIENTSRLLAEVALPQASIGSIAVDAAVTARLWAYPNTHFSGRVRSIAPNADAGDYGPVVRVQVVFDEPDPRLKPGLTGNAKIAAGWEPAGLVFTRAVLRFVMVELWSWIP